MVFNGFWLVSMVFQGGFIVFHVYWLVSMIFKVVSWFFMVFGWFHGFSWFLMVPGCFFMVLGWFSSFFSKMYPPRLYPGPTIQSRSAARRAA